MTFRANPLLAGLLLSSALFAGSAGSTTRVIPCAAQEDDVQAKRLAYLERSPYHARVFEDLVAGTIGGRGLEQLAADLATRQDPAGIVLHARTLAAMGRHADALERLALAPAGEHRALLEATWHERLGDLRHAAQLLASVETLDPLLAADLARARVRVALRLGGEGLEDAHAGLLRLDPTDPAPAEDAVRGLLAVGRPGAAANLLEELDRRVDGQPAGQVTAAVLRADVARAQGDREAELLALLRARGLLGAGHWQRPELETRLRGLYRDLGRVAEWLGTLEAELRADLGDRALWRAFLLALQDAGMPERALEVARAATDAFPSDEELARTWIELLGAFRPAEERVAALQRALDRGALGPDGWIDLGVALLDLGRAESGDAALRRGLGLEDDLPVAWSESRARRAEAAWSAAGRTLEVAELWNAALDDAPEDWNLRDTCVRAWVAAGESQRADAVLDAGLARLRLDAPAQGHDPLVLAAELLVVRQRSEQALQLLRQGWAVTPTVDRGLARLGLRDAGLPDPGIPDRVLSWELVRAARDRGERARAVRSVLDRLRGDTGTTGAAGSRAADGELRLEYLALQSASLAAHDPLRHYRLALELELRLELPAQGTRLAILEEEPADAELREDAARAFANWGHARAALEHWEALAEHVPERAFRAATQRALLLHEQGQGAAARELLDSLREGALVDDLRTRELADAYRSLGDPRQAWTLLRDAAGRRPRAPRPALELVHASLGLREAAVALDAARVVWSEGDTDQREEVLRALAKGMGSVKRLPDEVARLQRSLREPPTEVEDHLLLVEIFSRSRAADEARQELERLWQTHPEHPVALRELMQRFADAGRFHAAGVCAERLARRVGDADGSLRLRRIQWHCAAGEREVALALAGQGPAQACALAAMRGGDLDAALLLLGASGPQDLATETLQALHAELPTQRPSEAHLRVLQELSRRADGPNPWVPELARVALDLADRDREPSRAVPHLAAWARAEGFAAVDRYLARTGRYGVRRPVLSELLGSGAHEAALLEELLPYLQQDGDERKRSVHALALARARRRCLAEQAAGVPGLSDPGRLLALELEFGGTYAAFHETRWRQLRVELADLDRTPATRARAPYVFEEALALGEARLPDAEHWAALHDAFERWLVGTAAGASMRVTVAGTEAPPWPVPLLLRAVPVALRAGDLVAARNWVRTLHVLRTTDVRDTARRAARELQFQEHAARWAALRAELDPEGVSPDEVWERWTRLAFRPRGAALDGEVLLGDEDGLAWLAVVLDELHARDAWGRPLGARGADWLEAPLALGPSVVLLDAFSRWCVEHDLWQAARVSRAALEQALPFEDRRFTTRLEGLQDLRLDWWGWMVQEVQGPNLADRYLATRLGWGREVFQGEHALAGRVRNASQVVDRGLSGKREAARARLALAVRQGDPVELERCRVRLHELDLVLGEFHVWSWQADAASELEELAASDPWPAELWRWAAVCREREGRLQAAEHDWRRALEALRPPPDLLTAGRGLTTLGALQQFRPHQARVLWEPAVDLRTSLAGRLGPGMGQSGADRLNLALLLASQGRAREARAVLADSDPERVDGAEDGLLSDALLETFGIASQPPTRRQVDILCQLRAIEPGWLPVLEALALARENLGESTLDPAWLGEFQARRGVEDGVALVRAAALFE